MQTAQWRTGLRSVPRALFGSPAATQLPLQAAQRDIQLPLALARRVGFVQVAGGVGASTLSAHVLATLASCRPAKSLAVDAAGGAHSLLAHLGWREHEGTPDDRGFLTLHPRIAGIKLESNSLTNVAARHADWVARVEPVARFHDLVVTDWGRRPALDDFSATAKSSHVLVLVSRTERDALEQAAAIIPALRLANPRPRVVLVATDIGNAGRRADLGRIGQSLDVPTHVVPFDRARGRQSGRSSAHTSLRTRIAIAEITATIVREAEHSLTATAPLRGAIA